MIVCKALVAKGLAGIFESAETCGFNLPRRAIEVAGPRSQGTGTADAGRPEHYSLARWSKNKEAGKAFFIGALTRANPLILPLFFLKKTLIHSLVQV